MKTQETAVRMFRIPASMLFVDGVKQSDCFKNDQCYGYVLYTPAHECEKLSAPLPCSASWLMIF